MAPPPKLNTDVVYEILLRLPLDDPAGLVRASAVCKPWFRTLTDPVFLRRYHAFHGTSRMLGFLHNSTNKGFDCFVPTTAFRPHAAAAAHRTCCVLDCRHGRVLLHDHYPGEFIVWDPVTGREHRIPDEDPDYTYTNHAVLCAAAGVCDHSTCSGGPFLVACAGVHSSVVTVGESLARFYSSETGAWSVQSRLSHFYLSCLEDQPATLVGDALYFNARLLGDLLRYDVLGGGGLMLVTLPPCNYESAIVITAGNDELGLATIDDDMLALWSGEMLPNGDDKWSHIKLIDLQNLLPIDIDMSSAWLSGFAGETNLIFLSAADNGIFTIDLKSLLVRKVCEMGNVDPVFPYVSFYTPAALSRGTLQSPVETQ